MDHCPPRCFFQGRIWPETYEFPACGACNADARLDEQALAVLVRVKSPQSPNSEWKKLAEGLKNNRPELVAEWLDMSRNEQKFALRESLGRRDADQLRQLGWGAINLGPLSKTAINRFMIKLAQALHFQHVGAPLDGVVYVYHVNAVTMNSGPELMKSILAIAPDLATIKRGNRQLTDQFIYRFNYNAEHGAMYAVVQFSAQFIFQVIALSKTMDERLAAFVQDNCSELPAVRFECFLKGCSTNI
jgi:hypothetical protein